MRIVFADDHPLIRSGVASVLALSGYEIVASVADGEAALEAIAKHQPDLAILDIRMPKMNGIEVIRQMQAMRASIPVVLLTADIEDEQLLDALRFDVRGIVFKDGAEDRLTECIRKVTNGERYIDKELFDRALQLSLTPTRDPLKDLSPRELELAKLVSQGLRNREIAERMAITEGTVKVYLNTIYGKLGLGNRTALALLVTSRA